MKRAIPLAALLIVAAGTFAVMKFGGCNGGGSANTRIAQRKLYTGPSTLPVDAGDWPRWLGPYGDNISREPNLAPEWPKGGPPELWSAEVGIGYASPVATGGRVYLFSMNGNRETLTCFDANSGAIVWNEEGGKGRTSSYAGTRATPCIDGGDIFTLGGAGELTCRDASTGERRWVLDILEETGATTLDWGTASSPLVSGNLVFVQVGQGGPVALAVDRKTGKIAWKSQAEGISGYASPILINVGGMPQLIVFGGKATFAMDPQDGRTIWEHKWQTSYDVNASTPIYRDGHLFLTSAYGTGATVLKLSKDGKPTEVWKGNQAQSRFQPAILDGDALYVNSEGTLVCLSWPSGSLRWRDETNALKLGIGGSLLRIPGGRMISLGERGQLSLSSVTPDGVKVISSVRNLEGTELWAMPLVYGGRLYVKGTQEFVCYDVSSGPSPTTREALSAR
jgi:outer membrane protein assembly factor BamB